MVSKEKKVHPIELIHPRSLKFLSDGLHELVKGKLWLKVLIGMFLGIIVGLILNPSSNYFDFETSSILAEWISLPGILFLRGIQLIVIPLIIASIIRGIAGSNNINTLKKEGITTITYFLFTTIIAIIIGIFLATMINPGQYVDSNLITQTFETEHITATEFKTPGLKEIPQLISAFLPTNIFGSMLNNEMLQIVILALIFGIALVSINPKKSLPMLELLGSLQEVCMTIVKWFILIAPLAVFGLMAKLTAQTGIETLIGTSVYIATVILGLLLLLGFYSLIVFIVKGMNPIKFFNKIRDVQLLAFSTSSSAAVMPLTMKTAEEKLNVRPSITQFIIPIGTTINMDGTAIYQTIAIIFLAQVFGIHLSLIAILFLIVLIVGSSIGSPGTPGVGIVILAVIAQSIGIPVAGIALILGVDRILDMMRTTINVTGDLTAAIVLNKLIGGEKTTTEELEQQTKFEKQRKEKEQDIILIEKPQLKKVVLVD
jgi:Na+/H+-dicarboxylate symporter